MKAYSLLLGAAVTLLLGTSCSSTSRSFDSDEDAAAGEKTPGDPSGEDSGTQEGETPSGEETPGNPAPDAGDGPEEVDASLATPMDAATPAGDPDASPPPEETDAAAPPECSKDFDCDDGVDCTEDTCTPNGCKNSVRDDACVQAAGGRCDAETGCQYPNCTAETCSAGPCKTAMCVNDVCVRESLCDDGESCCAGACVPIGCDDGVSCTFDFCGTTGCEHKAQDALCGDKNACTTNTCDAKNDCVTKNNTASCDDGVFCNGADRCSGGKCSEHQGEPCAGNSQCDEDRNTCTGCANNSDCPDDVVGEWTVCDFGQEFCSEQGRQTRTVTSFSCDNSGSCAPQRRQESRVCERKRSGETCDDPEFGDETACKYDDLCTTIGSKQRERTDFVCSAGKCQGKTTQEPIRCTRVTNGRSCGLCQTCDANQKCATTPKDDSRCKSVNCPDDTECTNHSPDITTNRCASFGVCKTTSSCTAELAKAGTDCGGICEVCGAKGNCGAKPATDEECKPVKCPASTVCRKYGGDITTNLCAAVNQCKTAKSCKFENVEAGTPCGSELQCNGTGACVPPTVSCPVAECDAGLCCFNGKTLACGKEKCRNASVSHTCDERSDCNSEKTLCCGRYRDGLLTRVPIFSSACADTCKAEVKGEQAEWLCKERADCPAKHGCTGKLLSGQGFCQPVVPLPL